MDSKSPDTTADAVKPAQRAEYILKLPLIYYGEKKAPGAKVRLGEQQAKTLRAQGII